MFYHSLGECTVGIPDHILYILIIKLALVSNHLGDTMGCIQVYGGLIQREIPVISDCRSVFVRLSFLSLFIVYAFCLFTSGIVHNYMITVLMLPRCSGATSWIASIYIGRSPVFIL